MGRTRELSAADSLSLWLSLAFRVSNSPSPSSTPFSPSLFSPSHCYQVISSMGSACKADPTAIRVMDISQTTEDKLARAVRARLRKHGIHKGIQTVVSLERPQVHILPVDGGTVDGGDGGGVVDNPQELAPLPNFRVRILPVVGRSAVTTMIFDNMSTLHHFAPHTSHQHTIPNIHPHPPCRHPARHVWRGDGHGGANGLGRLPTRSGNGIGIGSGSSHVLVATPSER